MKGMADIIIVGAGASGLVAGIMAARAGKSVTILDHKDKIGRKILATGNGKCNFTNIVQNSLCYRGEDPSFAMKVLEQFGLKETLDFFRELGIYPREKNGYYYPGSQQASSILDVLRWELEYRKVKIKCSEHVIGITKKDVFYVSTDNYTYTSDKVVLATGGCSSSNLGSDGSGFMLAKKLGHHITPLVPALTALRGKGDFFKELAGIRVEAVIELYACNKLYCKEKGEIQMTDYGISGIPVFQVSRFAGIGLEQGKKVFVKLDFMPAMTQEQVEDYFWQRIELCGYKTIEQQFHGFLNSKLAVVLIKRAGLDSKKISKNMSREEIQEISLFVKEFMVSIQGTNSFDYAQVTAGGVATNEIDSRSMESKLVPNLYLCGEVIDVDGTCGGYNLQWAWSTGAIAGTYAART